MVLLGLGQGLGFAPLTAAGVAAIDRKDAGAASGLVNVAHQLGGALGVSVMVTVASGGRTVVQSGLADETSRGLFTGAALLGLAVLASALLVLQRRRPLRKGNA
jgi:sugar phosphate permease